MLESYSPLFVTSPARGGSTLLAQILNAHGQIALASDVYFPLYRSLRNAIMRHAKGTENGFDPSLPLQDYYFADQRIRMMDCIQAGDSRVGFDQRERTSLIESICHRASHESPDVVPCVQTLNGSTYEEWFNQSLQAIAKARGHHETRWAGTKEVWNIEFFTALAAAFPTAKLIVLLRDPRAIVASSIGVAERDPSQAGHVLSYARHWRKYVAFWIRFRETASIRSRVHLLTYEQLVENPVACAKRLCRFLDVDYDEQMIDANRFCDVATGKTWQRNSSYENQSPAITESSVDRWRDVLTPGITKLVELVCGPEMELLGYDACGEADTSNEEILAAMNRDNRKAVSWRSDLGNAGKDYGHEIFRRALLTQDLGNDGARLVRQAFLFPEVFQQLRASRGQSKVA